jgi:hypothetical protein
VPFRKQKGKKTFLRREAWGYEPGAKFLEYQLWKEAVFVFRVLQMLKVSRHRHDRVSEDNTMRNLRPCYLVKCV